MQEKILKISSIPCVWTLNELIRKVFSITIVNEAIVFHCGLCSLIKIHIFPHWKGKFNGNYEFIILFGDSIIFIVIVFVQQWSCESILAVEISEFDLGREFFNKFVLLRTVMNWILISLYSPRTRYLSTYSLKTGENWFVIVLVLIWRILVAAAVPNST